MNAFKKIIKGNNWINLVEWDKYFMINQRKLDNELKSLGILPHFQEDSSLSNSSIAENRERLLNKFEASGVSHSSSCKPPSLNIGLLGQAICAYVFDYHNLNIRLRSANIISKQYVTGSSLLSCFEIQKDTKVLYFLGAIWKSFAGKTLVIQIVGKKGKILREFWLHGIGNNLYSNRECSQEQIIL